MSAQPRQNRTFICSVLFLDIVEYSKQPVATQIRVKEKLSALLTDALKDVAQNDRIILDTGDGVALNFIGNPEDALFVSMTIRDDLAADQSAETAFLRLRMGINLGPVRLVKDINGQPNIIGDGINVAQRVMSFAQPGQILVSHSYHEVVSCLSGSYSALFQYEGAHTDKHVREHEVYAVGSSTADIKRLSMENNIADSRPGRLVPLVATLSRAAGSMTQTVRRRPLFASVGTAITIMAVALGIRLTRVAPPDDDPLPAPVKAASVGKAAPAAKVPPSPAAKAKDVADKAERTAPVPVAASAQPNGTVSVAVSPWGEVYVDGVKRGVSPPLREIQITPGPHTIEFRNSGFAPHVRTINVSTGARVRVQHTFN